MEEKIEKLKNEIFDTKWQILLSLMLFIPNFIGTIVMVRNEATFLFLAIDTIVDIAFAFILILDISKLIRLEVKKVFLEETNH